MRYRLDVNSPETYQRFSESDRSVVGVRPRYRTLAETVEVGDLLLGYVTGLSRWVGLFEVTSTVFGRGAVRVTRATTTSFGLRPDRATRHGAEDRP